MPTRQENEEMSALSLEVFGSKSKWRKVLENGETTAVLEDAAVLSKDGKTIEGTKKVQTMHIGPNGGEIPKFTVIRYTVETLKARMEEMKAERDKVMAAIAKFQEEQKAAQEKKQRDEVIETFGAIDRMSGTAVSEAVIPKTDIATSTDIFT